MSLTVDQVVAAYIKLRDKKASLEAVVQEQTEELVAQMTKLETWLREQASAQGVTSFKTPHGTAFLTTVDYAQVKDWDAVIGFIRRNDAYDMLERRVSKRAVRSYIDENKAVPDGITYGTRLEVNVRRPTVKAEG